MLIRKFKENPGMQGNLSESKVVLDPDLIDLTMIPPPMTPDEVMKQGLKLKVSHLINAFRRELQDYFLGL